MIHAPVQPFFGNWLYWQAGALAPNVGLWLRTLALPRALRRARGKRLACRCGPRVRWGQELAAEQGPHS